MKLEQNHNQEADQDQLDPESTESLVNTMSMEVVQELVAAESQLASIAAELIASEPEAALVAAPVAAPASAPVAPASLQRPFQSADHKGYVRLDSGTVIGRITEWPATAPKNCAVRCSLHSGFGSTCGRTWTCARKPEYTMIQAWLHAGSSLDKDAARVELERELQRAPNAEQLMSTLRAKHMRSCPAGMLT